MTITPDQGLPCINLKLSLPSEVTAISPFVDNLMLLLKKSRCVSEGEADDVEIALREALANAIIHGNHGDRRKHVHVCCRCDPDEVSITVGDEGPGFDSNSVPDPTGPRNIGFVHGRGIHVMKALMDEVRFDKRGTIVHMRKTARQTAANKDSKTESSPNSRPTVSDRDS